MLEKSNLISRAIFLKFFAENGSLRKTHWIQKKPNRRLAFCRHIILIKIYFSMKKKFEFCSLLLKLLKQLVKLAAIIYLFMAL